MTIPKVAHIAWNDKTILSSTHPMIENGLKKLSQENDDWKIIINTDEDIDYYLKNVLVEKNYNLVKDIGIVPKTDIWRLLKLYNEGGLYIDIDRLCNKKISSFLKDGIMWVVPICNYRDFSHDFMMTAPGNPVFANTINLYFERRHSGFKSVYFLGAQTYMHGITQTIFNKIIDIDPGEAVFKDIESTLKKIPFVYTVNEKLPYDSIIYNGNINYEEWEEMKRSFYAKNNIKHWTGEW